MLTDLPLPSLPLCFQPVYQQALWGGTTLARRFARTDAPSTCSESWEISAHPAGPSVVVGGPAAGQTLAQLARRLGAALAGRRAPDPAGFPLLFKLIDAQTALSVQVHPNETNATAVGGEPKTEMWYVVEAAPGACIHAGLRPGTTPGMLRAALAANQADELLVRHDVAAGDAILIRGGLVHAIGAGCLIYEVQQSSNTTFRLYDWGRVGPDGQPRELHVEAALKVIDWALPPPAVRRAPGALAEGPNRWTEILACPIFRMRRLELAEPLQLRSDGDSFHALFVLQGTLRLDAANYGAQHPMGTSILLPAALADCRLTPQGGPATVLVTTLGALHAEQR